MGKKIMPLRPFSLGDGRVGTPGKIEDVSDTVAHQAHAFGNARILTAEEVEKEASGPPEAGEDTNSQDRDPKVRKR